MVFRMLIDLEPSAQSLLERGQPGPAKPGLRQSRRVCLYRTSRVSGIKPLRPRLLLLSTVSSRFTYVAACEGRRSPRGGIVLRGSDIHVLFLGASVDGHLGQFHLSATMNNTAVDVCVSLCCHASWVDSRECSCWVMW